MRSASARAGDDVALTWEGVSGAGGYDVWFVDVGALARTDPFAYYQVRVHCDATNEGP